MSVAPNDDWHHQSDLLIRFVDENPKKNGTKAFEKYERYKVAATVGHARELGASGTDLQFDYKRKYLTILDENPAPQPIENHDDDESRESIAPPPKNLWGDEQSQVRAIVNWQWRQLKLFDDIKNKQERQILRLRRQCRRLGLVLQTERMRGTILRGYIKWGGNFVKNMFLKQA